MGKQYICSDFVRLHPSQIISWGHIYLICNLPHLLPLWYYTVLRMEELTLALIPFVNKIVLIPEWKNTPL